MINKVKEFVLSIDAKIVAAVLAAFVALFILIVGLDKIVIATIAFGAFYMLKEYVEILQDEQDED